MKTKCYCVLCEYHPLFRKRDDLIFPTGWHLGKTIWKPEELESGADVECLLPESPAFDLLQIDSETFEYPVTAYGDGKSHTGFTGRGFDVFAYCANERGH